MMSTEISSTMLLMQQEMRRYNVPAELLIESALPSFEIRAKNGKPVIAAPNETELLYGVYDYAERFNGWDFFEPGNDAFHPELIKEFSGDGVIVPAKEKKLDRVGFIQEFPFSDDAYKTLDWMAKNKANYLMVWMEYYDRMDDKIKEFAAARGIIIESGHHNFNYLIPPEKYRKDHPDFFADTAANRQRQLAGMPEVSRQLCTTNPALRAELVKNLRQYHEDHPEVTHLGLNPNDGFGWCECENCSKLYDKSSMGDSYCRSEKYYRANGIFNSLIDDVGAQLHEAAPELKLNFFAYVNYSTPAPGFKLKPGTGVHLALYWRCINHAVNDPKCGINSGYFRDILAWQKAKAGGDFNIYEYYMGINFYLAMPMLHFENMFKEIDLYHDCKVNCVSTQFWLENWSAYGINYYFMVQAARGEKFSDAMERFYTARFGKMADAARRFYGKLQKILQNLGACHIPHVISFLSRTTIEELEDLREDAALIGKICPLLPGSIFPVWVEYMIRFKKIYDLSLTRRTPAAEVREFLDWILSHQEAKLFVPERFTTFFESWFEDIENGKDWRYFTENDWQTEYDRHPCIAPEV
ncbi:MAG: DUF4838 domain-containing protein [Lentisphaerae bacterium]|nr:DUF4838 domain-containing protein [Lentisphaerota bacterium]